MSAQRAVLGIVPTLALTAAAVLCLVAAVGCGEPSEGGVAASPAAVVGDAALSLAYDDHASGVLVEGGGVVVRLLPDDLDGGRHQRFILALASGQTVLVAHNIDVAPRLGDLRVGDRVDFRGVYEWSEKGGTVHWTHHDPSGDHPAGWLRHDGRTVR